jgi:high-affinity nickel-transport protein
MALLRRVAIVSAAMDLALLGVLGGMVVLGFRHGFDWDHIAAITDITSTTTASHADEDVPAIAPMPAHDHEAAPRPHEHSHAGAGALHVLSESRFAHEQRHAIGLASLYALGHASVVAALGIAALLVGAVLPDWVDPILEKVVGLTLVLLGVWVLISVVQYMRGKGEFRMRSRWMLVFDGARYAWDRLQARIHGHEHRPMAHASQYGPRTAFGVGMIHGVGAETGSQALLLAGVAGVTGAQGVVILVAFIVGLLVSNTLVAVTSATGFIGAQRLRTLYVIVGAVAGVSSLVIGVLFIAGLGTALPDLQELLFGPRP